MNREQLIEEVLAGGFEQYRPIVDNQSLRRWVKLELLRFGGNVMLSNERTLKVENGKAKLPENFWELNLAMKVTLSHITGEGDYEDFLQNSMFYRERNEVDVLWDNESDSYKFKNFKCVEEKIYLRRATVKKHYMNPRYLKLTKGFNREKISPTCHNLSKRYTHSAEHEINITGDYINCNFNEGYIYIQYNGLDVDEQGEILIPDGNHNSIEKYLTYYCKMRILEDVVMGDDPDKLRLLSYYNEKVRTGFQLAQTDASFYGAQGWRSAMKKSMWKNYLLQERLLPNR